MVILHYLFRLIKFLALLALFPVFLFIPSFFIVWGGNGASLNEPVQDWVEARYGIAALARFDGFPAHAKPESVRYFSELTPFPTYNQHGKLENVEIVLRGFYNSVFFYARPEPPNFKGEFTVNWNDRIAFQYVHGFRDMAKDSAIRPAVITSIFTLFIVCSAIFIVLTLAVRWVRPDRFRSSLIRSLVVIGVLGIWTWGWWLVGRGGHGFIHREGRGNASRDSYRLAREHRPELDRLLRNTTTTALKKVSFLPQPPGSMPLEERCAAVLKLDFFPLSPRQDNIHHGHVFVAGTPLAPSGYVRINVDLFHYLFYAPAMTSAEVRKINPKMEWIPCGDGFYLGRYHIYFEEMQMLADLLGAYFVVWVSMVLALCRMLTAVPRPPRPPQPPPSVSTANEVKW